jgi:hypothetical protein
MLSVAISAFQILSISPDSQHSLFEPDLMPNMFRISFFFATSSLKHHTASYTPNVIVSSLRKTVLDILVQITRVHTFIRIVSFSIKTFLQRIYTSKILEHWFSCILNSSW